MTPEQVIKEVQESASEWLEMIDNPAEFTAGILAHKIVKLTNYIEYLEKRIHAYERSSMSNIARN